MAGDHDPPLLHRPYKAALFEIGAIEMAFRSASRTADGYSVHELEQGHAHHGRPLQLQIDDPTVFQGHETIHTAGKVVIMGRDHCRKPGRSDQALQHVEYPF